MKDGSANQGLAPSFDRDGALRFPLMSRGYDAGVRYLFDFAVLANSLRHRPGAVVLDFACGPGYVSELLNRFGYSTVAVDRDGAMLDCARERLTLDPRCEPARSAFAAGDGMQLPFRDASFDAIVCMNALHHMPDYRAALAEMHRVLRPAGQALFSEPGSAHSTAPESVGVAQQYGVIEKDVVLAEIHRLAREVGFSRMLLKPYVYPDAVDLQCEELDRFRRGKRLSTPNLAPRDVADIVERSHPLFVLEKAGTLPLTSATASPQLLRAHIAVDGCDEPVAAGGRLRLLARCRNTGTSTWIARPRPLGGHVTLGVKILRTDGRLIDADRGRTEIGRDVAPGDSIDVAAELSLAGLDPGSYRLLVDMVNEQVCWFQFVGSQVAERPLRVGQ